MRLARLLLPLATLLSLAAFPAAAELHYNQVSLRAEAGTEITHDLMQVTLYSEAQDSDASALAARITTLLNEAISQGKQYPGIKMALGSRSSHPVHDNKGKQIIAWRERAELRLESGDFVQLSKLVGELLQDLNMASMRFVMAENTRLQGENRLMEQAIAAFKERAMQASKALGGKDYKLVSLNLGNQGGYPSPVYRQAVMMSTAMADTAVTPEIEAGSSQLKIIADGIIEIIY